MRTSLPVSRVAPVLLVVASLLAALVSFGATQAVRAATGTLYAATGAGSGDSCDGVAPPASRLYTLDADTGAHSLVGTIQVQGQDVYHVGALAVDPTDGTMYAVANHQDFSVECTDWGRSTLLTIDPATAAATVVGDWGSITGPIPDMSFDPWGTLVAWTESNDAPVVLDTSTGTVSDGPLAGCSTAQTGFAIDSAGWWWVKDGGQLRRVSHLTGSCLPSVALSGDAHNLLAFDASGTMWTGTRHSEPSRLELSTIDPETGDLTLVSTVSLGRISAIEWDRTGIVAPDEIDLALTKSVDVGVVNSGAHVTYTITATNQGQTNATGVAVRDLLPAGFQVVSEGANPSTGTFDPIMSVWTIGALGAGQEATLRLTVSTGLAAGEFPVNEAEVSSSDQRDVDSFPLDQDGDDRATATLQIVIPGHDLSVTGVAMKSTVRASARSVNLNVTVANAGSQDVTFSSADHLRIWVAGSNQITTCRAVHTNLVVGRSVTVRCKAALGQLGLTAGTTFTVKAAVAYPFDDDASNDETEVTIGAT